MHQQHIERFINEFVEFDLKHLEMYGFRLVRSDEATHCWAKQKITLAVSYEPIEGYLFLKFELHENGVSIFASLDVVFHHLGGRGILLSTEFSQPRTVTDFPLKRLQWLAMLEKIEPFLKDSTRFGEIIKGRRNSLVIWPPPELRLKPNLGE